MTLNLDSEAPEGGGIKSFSFPLFLKEGMSP